MVEGCGQGLLGANWGDGLATDPMSIAALNANAPGSDPNPFFRTLLQVRQNMSLPWDETVEAAPQLHVFRCLTSVVQPALRRVPTHSLDARPVHRRPVANAVTQRSMSAHPAQHHSSLVRA